MSLGRWLPDRVVHVRSYSKSHGPDLRIAALGGPSSIVDRIVARRMLGPAWTSRMVQTILLDLLTSSPSLDEVGEARRQYMSRQRTLVRELAEPGCRHRRPDGINLWLPVRDERAARLHLSASGIRVAGGSSLPGGRRRAVPPGDVGAGVAPTTRRRSRLRSPPPGSLNDRYGPRYPALMTSSLDA